MKMVLAAHLQAKLCKVGLRSKTRKHQCIFTTPEEKKNLKEGDKTLETLSQCYSILLLEEG